MIVINYLGKTVFEINSNTTLEHLQNKIIQHLGFSNNDYYLIKNGKRFSEPHITEQCIIHVTPRLNGGKGGFGSMLRAIGAQIEKTTNREACRDLSGRRLRDINEEKRLKTWLAQQTEREKEAENRREKKLERLCQQPKHEFKDEDYEKTRSDLTEKVEDALEEGLKASTSSGEKRKHEVEKEKGKKKKKKIWLGSEDELSSDSDDESENDDERKDSSGESDKNEEKREKSEFIENKSEITAN